MVAECQHNQTVEVPPSGTLKCALDRATTFLEENRQNIFYLMVFFIANAWLFMERFIREFDGNLNFFL